MHIAEEFLFFTVNGVVEGCADGSAVLRILGDVEPDVVERLESGEYLLALRQEREVADEHEVADIAAQRGEPCCRAYRLEHHVDEAYGDVFLRGVALGVGEIGSSGVHRQSRHGDGADVADGEVDIADIALLSHFGHLLDIIGVKHDAGQSCECAAANADTADVAHLVAVTFHERGTRTHRHDDGVVEF